METERAGQALTAREIFDLVREDLEQVEKAIDVESVGSVETVTAIGRYLQQSGGKRLRPRPAPALRALRRRRRQDRHPARRRGRNDSRRHAGARRCDRRRPDPPRPPFRQRPVGQSHLRAGGRLALHAGLPDRPARTQLPHSRSADRPHSDDGRRRTDPARPHRPHRRHRSRLHGTGGPQDRLPVLRLRAAGRGLGRRATPTSKRSWASSPGTSAWPSS